MVVELVLSPYIKSGDEKLMVKVEIVNTVATASVNQKICLNELGKCKEISYNPKVYRGRVAYFRTMKMRGKVSIFLSGKMISVGTKSECRAFQELELAKDFLVEKGFAKPLTLHPVVRNIVATGDFGKSISLEVMSEDSKAIYEPEQFPGAILRIKKPFKVSILVFASGKIVLTGLKSSIQIKPVIKELTQLLKANR